MASLPKVTDLGRRPTPNAAGGIAQYGTDTGSDLPARATLSVAGDLEQTANHLEARRKVIAHEARIEQDRMDTLRAEQAFNELRRAQMDLTAGEKNGFIHQKGSAAVARSKPLYDEWTTKFDDAKKNIGSTLVNDGQRQRFNARADVAGLQFGEELLRHTASEGEVYGKEVYEGTVQTEIQNAMARWPSKPDVDLSIGRIEAAVTSRAEELNWPAEYKQAILQQELGKVHAGVIQQAIASNQTAYAEEWFKQHRDQIDPGTARVLEKAVEDGGQKQLVNDYTAQFLSVKDNRQALDQLAENVLNNPTLHDDRKNMVYGRILSRSELIERREIARQQAYERGVEQRIKAVNTSTLAGYEPTTQQMEPLLSASKGNTNLEAQAKQMIALANATRQFRAASVVEQEQALAHMESVARTDPTRFDINVVNSMRGIHDNQKRQLREDPVSFGVSQGLVPPEPVDLSNPNTPDSAAALQRRFANVRQLRDSKGAAFKPLTPEEVGLVSSTLKRVDAEGKRKYFGALMAASGDDIEGYSAIMSQIAPDDPVTAVAGMYAGRERNLAADLMLRGQAILNPPKGSDGHPEKGKTWPMPPDKAMDAEFLTKEQDAFAGRPQLRNTYLQATKAIYAARSAEAGDSTGEFISERFDEAFRLATGGVQKYNGKAILLPYGYDKTEFIDGVDRRIDQLLVKSQGPLNFGPDFNTYLTAEQERDFQEWKRRHAPKDSGQDYDLRGAYVAGVEPDPKTGHWPDTYKKPNHPTFSDQSRYAPYGTPGTWQGEAFTPAPAGSKPQRTMEANGRLAPGIDKEKLRDMPLEPIGDGRYVFRAGDGVLVDQANRPVIIDFNTDTPVDMGPPEQEINPAMGRAFSEDVR